jgi:8-oxo-dGTP diphosphatase
MKEVAVGILFREDKVLAGQRRKDAAYPLKWEFPGGKLEPGETPEEALRRELREELNIRAEIGQEIHRQEWVYPDSGRRSKGDGSFRVFYFRVTAFTGEMKNRAFERIRWLPLPDLIQLDFLEGNRETLEILLRHGHAHPET